MKLEGLWYSGDQSPHDDNFCKKIPAVELNQNIKEVICSSIVQICTIEIGIILQFLD